MRQESVAGLNVHLAGGEDREGGGSGPLVVLLHGFGAPGHDLVPLFRQLDVPRDVRFAFPEAPLDLGAALGRGYAGARAWWLIDLALFEEAARGQRPDRSKMVPEGLIEARAQVAALLEELGTLLGAAPSRTVLGGFSQGAMLATDVALHAAEPMAGLALLSGSLIAADDWAPRIPVLRGRPVLQSHGRADPILPFDAAVRLRDLLREGGADVRFIEFGGGHTIPAGALSGLGTLVRDATGNAS